MWIWKCYLSVISSISVRPQVCTSGEPKSELQDCGSGMFSKIDETGNVLSTIESQGLRVRKASAWTI
jgi:hypothetical protein